VVSSAANGAADPRGLAGRVSGPKGGYRIELTVTQTDPPSAFATDLGIQSYFSFTNTSFASSSPPPSPVKDVSVDVYAIAQSVGNVGLDEWAGPYDLDAYSFALDPGQTVQLDVDSARAQLISALDAFLRDRRIEWTVEQMDQAITVDNYGSLARSFRAELPFS